MDVKREEIVPAEGFSPGIGVYFAELEEVRAQLRDLLADLGGPEVAAVPRAGMRSIGELVLHIGEAEWWWIQSVVGGKEKSEAPGEIGDAWDVLKRTDFAEKGLSADDCLMSIDEIRKSTARSLSRFSDEDLKRYFGYVRDDGSRIEKSLRWILHHLIDHEAQHKGQILLARRLLQEA